MQKTHLCRAAAQAQLAAASQQSISRLHCLVKLSVIVALHLQS